MGETTILEAGTALDWEIARRVFGWTAVGVPSIDQVWFYAPTGKSTRHEIPPFSSDIAAAWNVIERMQELGWWARLTTPFEPGQPWFCGFTPLGTSGWNGRPDHQEGAETMPLAICRCALKALASDGVPTTKWGD